MTGSSGDFRDTHLAQLDERACWYGRQYWQVSLAYVGTAGLAMIQVHGAETSAIFSAMTPLAIGIAGIFVAWHLKMIDRNFIRLVNDIVRLERELNLRTALKEEDNATQREGSDNHRLPLLLLLILTAASSAIVGIYGLALHICFTVV